MNRSALFAILGINFLEWLEFSLYLYLAKSVFAQEFFPYSNHSVSLTFALFAAAYLARPVGGWLFGKEADVHGRRNPMIVSAGLMGAATLGICLLPSYAQIGIASTWLLLGLRMAQGLALGGEINTSAMFTVEHHRRNPLIAGSLVAAFGALGMFMGSALAAIVQTASISWLWRIIFALVGLISLWVCRLRKELTESPEFGKKDSLPVREIGRLYGRGMLNIAAVAAFVSVMVYICNVFWVSFAADAGFITSSHCAWIGCFAQLTSALLAIGIALICRPEQGQMLLQASFFAIALAAPILFYFTCQKILVGVLVGLAGYVLGNALVCASFYYFLYQQLPPQYRCRGVSTIWALAASVGAIALPVTEQAVSHAHWFWFPGLIVGLVALGAFFIIRRNLPAVSSKIGNAHSV